ncbi:hypothetical protein YC2023_045091 [Brassica napus]
MLAIGVSGQNKFIYVFLDIHSASTSTNSILVEVLTAYSTQYVLHNNNQIYQSYGKKKIYSCTLCTGLRLTPSLINIPMGSSSSSSTAYIRRKTVSIPSHCWCGANLTTSASLTKENQSHRFYLCELGIQV